MFNRVHSFSHSLTAEDTAAVAYNSLLFNGIPLQDVRKDKNYQKRGFDYICAEKYFVEAKYERYASGNIALEVVSVDRPSVTPGWMFSSETGVLVSVITPSAQIIVTPMQPLRAWLSKERQTLEGIAVNNRRYCTYSYLAPISRVLTEVKDAICLDFRDALAVSGKSVLPKKCTVSSVTEFKQLMEKYPCSKPVKHGISSTIAVLERILARAEKRGEYAQVLEMLPITTKKLLNLE